MREKLELVELRSETLTKEFKVLKAIKITQNERPAKNTSAENKVLTTNVNTTEREERIRQTQDQGCTSSIPIPFNSVGKSRIENQSYSSGAITKPKPSPETLWTQVNYGNQKSTEKQHRLITNPD